MHVFSGGFRARNWRNITHTTLSSNPGTFSTSYITVLNGAGQATGGRTKFLREIGRRSKAVTHSGYHEEISDWVD